jgi:hypothetical protein
MANDLESRVTSRKRELIEELIEHKKKSGQPAEMVDTIKRRLSELEELIKQNVAEGWDHVSPVARSKFDLWIAQ